MRDNKKFWQRVAKLYTPMQEKANKGQYDVITDKTKPYIEGRDVLELACGTGQLTAPLSVYARSWIATDFSEKMVDEAKARGIRNASFDVQDATALTYEDNSFDVVAIANALHIMPDPDKALSEIARVLRPDGILIAPTFVYQGKTNKAKLWLMERVGFKTYHKWTEQSMNEYVTAHGYSVVASEVIPAKPTSELFVVYRKNI